MIQLCDNVTYGRRITLLTLKAKIKSTRLSVDSPVPDSILVCWVMYVVYNIEKDSSADLTVDYGNFKIKMDIFNFLTYFKKT